MRYPQGERLDVMEARDREVNEDIDDEESCDGLELDRIFPAGRWDGHYEDIT